MDGNMEANASKNWPHRSGERTLKTPGGWSMLILSVTVTVKMIISVVISGFKRVNFVLDTHC